VSLWHDGINGIISDDPGLMLKARAGLPKTELLSA